MILICLMTNSMNFIENEIKNQGAANVIISVSTGALINYISVVLLIFAMLGFAAYLLVYFFKRK